MARCNSQAQSLRLLSARVILRRSPQHPRRFSASERIRDGYIISGRSNRTRAVRWIHQIVDCNSLSLIFRDLYSAHHDNIIIRGDDDCRSDPGYAFFCLGLRLAASTNTSRISSAAKAPQGLAAQKCAKPSSAVPHSRRMDVCGDYVLIAAMNA